LTLIGLGMTLAVTPLTTTVMASVPAARTGVASGINNAVARVAGLVAVAALGIVFTWAHEASLAARLDALHIPHQASALGRSLEPGGDDAAGGQARAGDAADVSPATSAGHAAGAELAAGAAAPRDAAIAHADADAIDAGFRAVALVCAVSAFCAAVCAALTITRK
jgi:hypothetical protein